MKKLIPFLLLVTLSAYSQENNIWYFGDHAGLDFNGGPPVELADGQLLATEGTASIADSNGQLLFYTDGITVWNRNHAVMLNGTGLLGHDSSTQSALIIPKPGSATLYYIFTTTAIGGPDGLCYSVVDMNLEGGFGAVTDKNISLYSPTCEKLAATWHSNGTDIWVVSHQIGTNTFVSHLVTSNGISAPPMTSNTGVVFAVSDLGQGQLKISPDGSRIAAANGGGATQVFDFHAGTGAVSNPVFIGNSSYGVEFSPSGNLLYVTSLHPFGSSSDLYQYDLTAANVAGSEIILFTVPFVSTMVGFMWSLQRGPDNKIYLARFMRRPSVISQPDILGVGCDFIAIGPNVQTRLGLPNPTITATYKIWFTAQVSCTGQESAFSMGSSQGTPDNWEWDFGDGATSTETNPAHIYQAAGNYTVKLTAHRQGITRIIENTIVVLPVPQANQPADLTLCDAGSNGTALFDLATQNAIVAGSQNPNDFNITYHTSLAEAEQDTNGLPDHYTNAATPQIIYVRIENKNSGCYATTSFDLIVTPRPVIDMQDSYVYCKGGSVPIAGPAGFQSYLWSTGETTRVIDVNQPGNYMLTVNATGNGFCDNSKTVTVTESEAPVITKIESTDWTFDQNTINVFASGAGVYEYSIDGINYQDSQIFNGLESGLYTVYVRDKNECGTVTKQVLLLMYPKFFTPNGDGFNDNWRIKYAALEPDLTVHIFDRYGKLITVFDGNSTGWDGRLNGSNLPATDYWFVVERHNGTQYRGHFAMVR